MDALLSSPFFTNILTKSPEQYRYGTAGFRMAAKYMPAAACRLGPVFVERAREILLATSSSNNNKQSDDDSRPLVFGVMVTASHNPSEDNGLKIVEPPHAHMLVPASEQRATQLARAHSAEDFKKLVNEVMSSSSNDGKSSPFSVIIGWDTRPSGKDVVDAIVLGIEAVGGQVIRAGEMSTPMLHWCVEKANHKDLKPVAPPLNLYLDERAAWFAEAVIGDAKKNNANSSANPLYNRHIVVDCANGVGTVVMKDLVKRLESAFASSSDLIKYSFQLINTDTDKPDRLNDQCGADFVQKQLRLPQLGGLTEEEFVKITEEARSQNKTVLFYSLDGDADRLVAGVVGEGKKNITILEGDRFAALFASILLHGVDKNANSSTTAASLTYGAVQTAYSNGAATKYLNSITPAGVLKTEFANTGVKYVHAAAEKYDLGLYFESNGHGTILVSDKAESQSATSMTPAGRTVTKICSRSCGDAIANLLATEFALLSLQWSTDLWLNMYTDLPCVQKKVPVPDPSQFKCAPESEQRLILPDGAQAKIDAAINELVQGNEEYKKNSGMFRAFVRPSGTESVVRLYVEGCSVAAAGELTGKLEELVKTLI